MEKRRSWPVRLFVGLYEWLNSTRRFVFNMFFLLLLIVFFSAMIGGKGPRLEKGSALILAPHGVIVEEAKIDNPFARFISSWADEQPPQTELRVLLAAIESAKTDSSIKLIVIDTSAFYGAGFSQIAEVREALLDFKSSGKKIIARGDYFSQSQYYLASAADEIYLDPMGLVEIDGFAKVQTYFKSALERFGVNVHVFRVGAFKSAVEPYIRDNMSEEDKTSTLKWMGALWQGYKTDVAATRKLTPDDIQSYADDAAAKLTELKGDTGALALSAKLVDGLKTRLEFDDYISEIVGRNEADDEYKNIDAVDYAQMHKHINLPGSDTVAVIIAEGDIVDGHAPIGMIGGDTISQQIRSAREDDDVKAIVLRVNSPGGSAFASEVIRRELQATQKAGKPVVVSMSSVAASGGYWISASADEIFAQPYTITGSIGIYGMVPTIDGLMNEYGVHRDGIGTTKLSGSLDLGRPLSPEVGEIIQQSINNGYERFLNLVSTSRKKSHDDVHAIAQGQVWDGRYASTIGLVDKMGNLHDALDSAAQHAKLGDNYSVRYIERPHTPAEELTELMGSRAQVFLPAPPHVSMNPLLWQAKAAVLQVQHLLQLNDPQNMYAHCMCVVQ